MFLIRALFLLSLIGVIFYLGINIAFKAQSVQKQLKQWKVETVQRLETARKELKKELRKRHMESQKLLKDNLRSSAHGRQPGKPYIAQTKAGKTSEESSDTNPVDKEDELLTRPILKRLLNKQHVQKKEHSPQKKSRILTSQELQRQDAMEKMGGIVNTYYKAIKLLEKEER